MTAEPTGTGPPGPWAMGFSTWEAHAPWMRLTRKPTALLYVCH